MKFAELAEYLEKLERVSSRLEMTRILAELFSKVTSEEGRVVAYLSQGMLGPKFANPDTGVAEKMVLKAIGAKFEMGGEEPKRVFRRVGDIGLVVEEIKLKHKGEAKGLKVGEVHEKLLEIAGAGGKGSQEKKIRLIGDLLGDLDRRSAKYVTRMILGKMRTGFSDMTVLDSLSWMVAGDKSLRSQIEKIYNVRADLGEVVRLVKEHENLGRLQVEPEVGTPVLVARAERAKTVAEIWERTRPSAAVEHKLDGLRIQAHIKKGEVKLFSRGLEEVTSMYPEVMEGLVKRVGEDCILDGEIIAVGKDGKYLPFQETVQRKRKYGILELMAKVPLRYCVFDVLSARGKSMLNLPNEGRWSELEKVLGRNKEEAVRLMPRKIVRSEAEIEDFFREALRRGTEGIMVKKLDGVYRSGSRDFNWIKYKKSYDESGVADTIDAVVMGYDAGEGKRVGFGIGGFLIGVYDKKDGRYLTIAKVGTGLKDEEWRELKARCQGLRVGEKPADYEVNKAMNCDMWVEPKIVVEVKCDEITKSPVHTTGFALRFPRLVSFREMKVEEAATPAEIKRLFDLQKKGGGGEGG